MVDKLKKGKTANNVYMETRESEGGIVGATNVSSLPRSVNQVQKLKQRALTPELAASKHQKKDELYAVISA